MTDNVALEIVKTSGIVISAILSLIGLVYGVKNRNKTKVIHEQMNGMKTELIEAVKVEYEAIGKAKGKDEQREQGQQTADAVVQTIKDDPDIDLTKKKQSSGKN